MIHWSTAFCVFWTLLFSSSIYHIAKTPGDVSDRAAKICIGFCFIETAWLAYFIYW